MFYSVVPFYTRVRSYSTRTLLFRGSIFDAGTLLLQRYSYLIGESTLITYELAGSLIITRNGQIFVT